MWPCQFTVDFIYKHDSLGHPSPFLPHNAVTSQASARQDQQLARASNAARRGSRSPLRPVAAALLCSNKPRLSTVTFAVTQGRAESTHGPISTRPQRVLHAGRAHRRTESGRRHAWINHAVLQSALQIWADNHAGETPAGADGHDAAGSVATRHSAPCLDSNFCRIPPRKLWHRDTEGTSRKLVCATSRQRDSAHSAHRKNTPCASIPGRGSRARGSHCRPGISDWCITPDDQDVLPIFFRSWSAGPEHWATDVRRAPTAPRDREASGAFEAAVYAKERAKTRQLRPHLSRGG